MNKLYNFLMDDIVKEKWISTNELQIPVDQVPDSPSPVLVIIGKLGVEDRHISLVVNKDGDYYFYDNVTGLIGKRLSDEEFVVLSWIIIEWP